MEGMNQNLSGLQDGVAMYNAGKYVEAIPSLLAYLEVVPDDTHARGCLAASYAQTGMRSDAVREFLKLTELEPKKAQHFYNLGIAYQSEGNTSKAVESFKSAIALSPGYEKARQRLDTLEPKPSASAARTSPGRQIQSKASTAQANTLPHQTRPVSRTQDPFSTYGPESAPRVSSPRPSLPASAPEGLNWGAFLLPFWWSIAHSAWLWAAISFFLQPVAAIVLLLKGNETGWSSRRFSSVDEFRSVQKAWLTWGLIVNAVVIIGVLVFWGAIAATFFSGMKQANQMNQFGQTPYGMPQFDGNPVPGAAVSVTPYPGAQKAGQPKSGRDESGSYISTTYKANASLEQVYGHFEGIAGQSGNYMSETDSDRANITIYAQSGMVNIQMRTTGSNQVEFTIAEYK